MKVEIEVFNIGRTAVDRGEVRRWLDRLGVEEFRVPPEGAISDPALLVALACKRAYMAFEVSDSLNPNLTRVRTDLVAYLDNVLASKHGSVCEHSTYSFAVEGCTRVMTAELNRHRAGFAITEGSQRFIRFGEDIPYWEPESVRGPDVLSADHGELVRTCEFDALEEWLRHAGSRQLPTADHRKQATRILFARAFEQQREIYRCLAAVWAAELAPEAKFAEKKKVTSLMRRVVGMGVATGGTWTGNLRALRHMIALRLEPAAEEEIAVVARKMLDVLGALCPEIFGDFAPDAAGVVRPKYVKI